MQQVHIYTDGGAEPNPGRGGLGVVLLYGPHRKELSRAFRHTTNNRMELLAVITALEALKGQGLQVQLHTDSKYVADAVLQRWVQRWQLKGWKNVKNPDLWQRLVPLLAQHEVHFVWVRGHAGNPENERCDALATAALQGAVPLEEDRGYAA